MTRADPQAPHEEERSPAEERPLVSCIVPCYNSERYLGEALDSILAQTYRPIEIVIVDDGSTDRTAAVAASYGRRVRYMSQPTAGPPATRNLGLRAALGSFVAFLDADDLWHKEKLARQMARFDARRELDLCITYVQNFWVEELSEEGNRLREHPRAQPIPGYGTTTLLARRRLFDAIGGFNNDLWFADAVEWFVRTRDQGAVMEIIPEALTYHRMHSKGITRRRTEASRDEWLTFVKRSLDRRRREAPDSDDKQ